MRNKYLVKLYVKLHYILYYIKHPKVWWQMRKIKDRNLRELMNLYIGRINMVDKEQTSVNWGLIILILSNIGWWVCVWQMGFFKTILYTIIGIASYMLWWNLKDLRA